MSNLIVTLNITLGANGQLHYVYRIQTLKFSGESQSALQKGTVARLKGIIPLMVMENNAFAFKKSMNI